MLVASNLRILHLDQGINSIFVQWAMDFLHECLSVELNFLKNFVDILLDREEICLDAFLLEELDVGPLSRRQQVGPRQQRVYIIFEVIDKFSEQFVGDEVSVLLKDVGILFLLVDDIQQWLIRLTKSLW